MLQTIVPLNSPVKPDLHLPVIYWFNMAPMQTFGQRLKRARESRYLTQEQLGERIGHIDTGLARNPMAVTRAAVSQWEKDLTLPTLEAAAAAAMVLARSLDHLIFGRGPTLDARIDALPKGFRDELLGRVLAAIKHAEDATRPLRRVEQEGAVHTLDKVLATSRRLARELPARSPVSEGEEDEGIEGDRVGHHSDSNRPSHPLRRSTDRKR